ncbi:hypothetical protein [Calothrix sp. 336/3]|uniref:slr1957 family protein n=1 Tax=Calothrix sp. 336/3 TaxID=1337936 RepID=UPI0004E3142D|nr:hypothetical protein [Calothrix sp. 336/3]AKG24662.1 hypothetical protein IJ00_15285 [Calothrix sp. 336/3]
MKHYRHEWIEEWCQENGWTDLFEERSNNYWAFPPGAVMPEPIPYQVLRLIKSEKGMTCEERFWSIVAVMATMLGAFVTFWLKCPIPLVAAFALNAVTVAQLEVEDAY